MSLFLNKNVIESIGRLKTVKKMTGLRCPYS